MKTTHCVDCGSQEVIERRRCKKCSLIFNRERVKKYYNPNKIRYGISTCEICKKELIKNRPDQTVHGNCKRKQLSEKAIAYNKVPRTKTGTETIGRNTVTKLGLVIKYLVVHHIDENPNNNDLSNLMIMSRSNHAKLHRYLEKQWSLFKKLNSSNLENCWNSFRDQSTKTWLETAGVNVIKMTDISQSAAEPLKKDNIYIF